MLLNGDANHFEFYLPEGVVYITRYVRIVDILAKNMII